MHLSKHVECTIPSVNNNANSALWVVTVSQGRLINENKGTTLLWDDSGGGNVCGDRKPQYFPLKFAVNLKSDSKTT